MASKQVLVSGPALPGDSSHFGLPDEEAVILRTLLRLE